MNATHRLRLAARAAVAAAVLVHASAQAHDTWFERLSPVRPPPQGAVLALGTGNQFPVLETGVGSEYLVQPTCRGAADTAALVPLRNAKSALMLRAPPGAQTCWLQMTAFDIELAPDKVAPYLDEMNASASLRASWAAMQARGLRWQERYTKHARIELTPGGATTPAPMGMDATLQRQGGELLFTVLRDGAPLPGLAVELRSAVPNAGSWHRTDEQGQLRVPEPPAGRWLLRAIDLRPAGGDANRWDSRFLTLAFDGGAGPVAAGPVAVGAAANLQR